MKMLTLFAEDAQRSATTDRERAADRVLCAAVETAIDLLRHGARDRAWSVLSRSGMSAERILGPTVAGAGTVWVLRNGSTGHVCTTWCAPDTETCCWGGARAPHTALDDTCVWCGTTTREVAWS